VAAPAFPHISSNLSHARTNRSAMLKYPRAGRVEYRHSRQRPAIMPAWIRP
jgi:hypothetical protein